MRSNKNPSNNKLKFHLIFGNLKFHRHYSEKIQLKINYNKTNFYQSEFLESKKDSKQTWKIINKLTGQQKNRNDID